MSETTTQGEGTKAGSAVPRSVFDTALLPPREAFARWQEQLDHMARARLAGDAERFHVRAESVILDNLVLGSIYNTNYFCDRSRFHVARDSLDHYTLFFFRKGRMICLRDGTGEEVKPGDIMLSNMSNADSAAVLDLHVLHIVIPRILLAPLLVEPDANGLRHFSGDDILVKLLYDHVNALYAQSRHITVEQASALEPALLEMAAAAINGRVREETGMGVSMTLKQAIRRHVSANALAADLTPERIAAQFGISPRKLSYLFQEDGGIASQIKSERLRLARLALMDPAQRGRTIAEIAEAHGFAYRTSFIRAFERAYGLSPSQQRAFAVERRNADRHALSDDSPMRWMYL